jgi:nicotinate-nucleotide adenylyltransferase
VNGPPIGVLGGTFDPVHNGHLRVAIEAYEALRLDHVRLVPLNRPAHRSVPLTGAALRCEMLRAVAVPPLVLDLREIERGGTSYTVDTLAAMRQEWPARPLCLIVGADAYATLPAWHRPAELLELAHIVVAARPGDGIAPHPGLDELTANAQAQSVDELHASGAGRVYFLDIPLLPIAARDLRARCGSGRDIRHLVPDAVHDIIKRHRLYQS